MVSFFIWRGQVISKSTVAEILKPIKVSRRPRALGPQICLVIIAE